MSERDRRLGLGASVVNAPLVLGPSDDDRARLRSLAQKIVDNGGRFSLSDEALHRLLAELVLDHY